MVTIPISAPTADHQVGGLQPFNAPVADSMKDATGAQIAQRGDALGKIGTTAIVMAARLEQEVQRTQDVADEAETARADAQFAQVVVKDMYGEGGYMNLTGLNATVDRWGQVSGSMHEKQEKIREGLSTEGSRKLFDRHQAGKWPALDAEGLRHAGTQSRAAHLSEALFRSEQEANLALQDVVHWNTPNSLFESQILTALGGLQQALAADGVPQAEIAAKMMKMKTAITSAAVNKLLASGTAEGATQAELYYQAHKEGIDQTVAGGLEKLVHDTVKIAEADQAGYDAFKETQSWASSPAREWNVGPTHLGPTLKDQIDHLDDRLAKKEITIGVHDAAVRRVKDAAAAVEAAVTKVRNDNVVRLYGIIDKNHLTSFDQLSAADRASAEGYQDKIKSYIVAGQHRTSDEGTVYNLLMASASAPIAFSKVFIPGLADKLSQEHVVYFAKLQADIISNNPVAKQFLDAFSLTMKIADGHLNAAGIDPTPKAGTDDAKFVARYRIEIAEQIAEKQSRGEDIKDYRAADTLSMDVLHKVKKTGNPFLTYFNRPNRAVDLLALTRAPGYRIPDDELVTLERLLSERVPGFDGMSAEAQYDMALRLKRNDILKKK